MSDETVSTIGEQKKFNYALQPMSREEFKRLVTAEQPDAPEYFVYDAIKNRQERTSLEEAMQKSMRAIPLEEVLSMRDAGAQLIDVRDAADFEGAHLQGALQIGLRGKYAPWCGALLDHDRPIVVVADSGDQEEAVMRLGRIGFDNVAGYLEGGMAALETRPDLVASVSRITARALTEQLVTQNAPTVIDVRSEKEHAAGHIEGSINVPLNRLREQLDSVPDDVPVVVHCEGGYRSAIAASLLSAAGRKHVTDLVGGYKAWAASQQPAATA